MIPEMRWREIHVLQQVLQSQEVLTVLLNMETCTHTHSLMQDSKFTHTYTLHTSTRGFWVSEGQFCLWDLSPHARTWLLVPKQFSGESTILRMFSPTWMLAEPLAQFMPSQPDWHSHAAKEAGAKGPSH